jgi:penicillin G amidase
MPHGVMNGAAMGGTYKPDSDARLQVAGLAGTAEILIDKWGIPHLTAGSLDDLWFLQGFNAARDRLWQIDLWRKRGLGLLAADFGPGYLEQDRAARLFLYRGDMATEYASYGPQTHDICARFVDGINAYIDLTRSEPDLLPPEFSMMGTRPQEWQPEGVLRIRSHGLTRNALWEVQRLEMLANADTSIDLLRKFLIPATDTVIPEGLTPGDVPLEALDLFRLAQANVTFSPERLAATLEQAGHWCKVSDLNEVLLSPEASGSNNWAVHGSRTETGAPILAGDPHRAHALPSLRYIVHLSAPGFDGIGAGEPSVPGLSMGHNGEAGFSLTIFGADQEDVYVYETDPADPALYRYGDGFEPMARHSESFAVKGYPDQTRHCDFTRHGPVIWRNTEKTRAVTVRCVWFSPGSAPYMASLKLMQARNLAEFREAASGWGTPSVNLLYADRAGNIAWTPAGFMPNRPNWKGLTPVPGDGRFEWDGFLDHSALPFVVNPDKGFIATANEMNLPDNWSHETQPIGFEWTEASRAIRLHEVLETQNPHTARMSEQLQTDVHSIPARRTCALLAKIPVSSDIAPAATLLRDWNHRLEADSAPAALFELWWTKHLKMALFDLTAPNAAARVLIGPGDTEGILQALEYPERYLGKEAETARDSLLSNTLAKAFIDATARMGPDPATWSWGRLHQGFFEHPLSSVPRQASTSLDNSGSLDIGPLPTGGSASTPMHTGYSGDFRVILGASFRMVMDLADLDRSTCINAPGQSGDPRSSHYADLAPLWAKGEYVPMLTGRQAIEKARHFTWHLSPA